MNINIVLPYEEAEKYYKKWAHQENEIDFRKQNDLAMRCTLNYACEELVTYLVRLGHNVKVSSSKKEDYNIVLTFEDNNLEEFDISSAENSLILHGYGRAGVLYSVYELLEAQGIRWYAPNFEYIPDNTDFILPDCKHYKYDLPKGRGFFFEDLQNESESFIVWMARNRLNIHAMHTHCKALQRKLCMKFETGGHIFADLLNPLNIETDGRYYIDTHRDWYGKRDEEITEENAMFVQFCVSNNELLERMSEAVIKKLQTDWYDIDTINLDGFDTWGKSCACEKCTKLGNGSDMTLKFISHIRDKINKAVSDGSLDHNVKLSFCIYDGTNTMEPPQNPVPKNLTDAGDRGIFSPILRCYKHYIDESCTRNNRYEQCFKGWLATGLNISVDEYYNVSKYEDLPFVCADKIVHDIRHYIKNGAEEFLYMHVFVKEWGFRSLNHHLMAVTCRNSEFDYEDCIKKYFNDMYGEYSGEVQELYRKAELATEYMATWRAWNKGSILDTLLVWDGRKPAKPIPGDGHIDDVVVQEGYKSAKLLKEALVGMRNIREKVLDKLDYSNFLCKISVNPVEDAKHKTNSQLLVKINEDIRGLKYGYDVFMIMSLMVDYYYALYTNDTKSETLYDSIYELGCRMSEYTYSVVFASYQPDFSLRDALLRSQLQNLYYRIISLHNKTVN